MPVFTFSLTDGEVAAIAERVARHLASSGAVTQSNPHSAETRTARTDHESARGGYAPGDEAPPEDPWTGQGAPSQNSAPARDDRRDSAPGGPPGGESQVRVPTCAHGPMIYRRAGVSAAGRAYPAFWACPTERNAPDKCKSVTA